MARVAENLRRQVFERAQGICEYCQTQQLIVINMHVVFRGIHAGEPRARPYGM